MLKTVTNNTTELPANIMDRSDRVAVIGAGTSGLAMVRRLQEVGAPVDCLEREEDLGGNWNAALPCSRVMASTHLISSKRLTEYLDYPMPDDWPEYPSHQRVLHYLQGYADRFGLRESIEFGVGVRSIEPVDAGDARSGWWITLETGERRRYRAVAIANGHNWDYSFPSWSGRVDPNAPYQGVELHSGEYKTPDCLAGKRVLVVGGGNSGCDLAAEASRHASHTRLSLRRGYHILPKFYRGVPLDSVGERMLRWRIPLFARRRLASAMAWLVLGPRSTAGLPKPDHRLFEAHPTINSELVERLRHGDLETRPDVANLTPEGVRFIEGPAEEFDLILYATGYKLSFPFIDRDHLNWRDGRPDLYLNLFHPQRDDLFVLGMIQPDSGQWGLVDRQARLVATLLAADLGSAQVAAFQQQKQQREEQTSIRYLDTPRHLLEVEHYSYARRLDQAWQRLRATTSVTTR